MMNPFSEGDTVVITDAKGREYLQVLKRGGSFSTHRGTLSHDVVFGKRDGTIVTTESGARFSLFRPTFNQYVLNLKRKAQIIYPKDIGPILLWGDIYPGAVVVEGGAGWGALSIALLRSIGDQGKLITYEIREDFANMAARNIQRFIGEAPNHLLKLGNIYEGIEEKSVDRIVLDVPEPWRALPHAFDSLRSGGILLTYLPTIIQVREVCEAIRKTPHFEEPEIFEVTLRPWNVKGQSVRPVSWTFSHSAFITVTRKADTVIEL